MCCLFWFLFLSVYNWSDSNEFKFWQRVWVQQNMTDTKMRERERERWAIYTGPSHKTWVVQSPFTFKGFHYNHYWLQLLKDYSNELPNVQAYLQETSNSQGYFQETFIAQGQLQETSIAQARGKEISNDQGQLQKTSIAQSQVKETSGAHVTPCFPNIKIRYDKSEFIANWMSHFVLQNIIKYK